MLVLNSTPLNQYIGRNPEYFFGASAEEGRINPEREASLWGGESLALGRNLHILISHIKCAAFELPIESDETFGSENLVEILGFLETQGFVHKSGESWQRERSRLRERVAHPRGVGRPDLHRRRRLAAERVARQLRDSGHHVDRENRIPRVRGLDVRAR